jgi:N-acetylmuramoyl-L-alanine amidase
MRRGAQRGVRGRNGGTLVRCGGLGMAALCAWLLTPGLAEAQARDPRRAQAAEQFKKAESMRTAIAGKPAAQRSVAEYQQLAQAFRRVYLITPHAAEVPAALLAVAETYHEMGRQFDKKHHQQALDAYLFLLKHYPTSRYRDDALFTIAHIQHEDLGDLEAAEETYKEFLQRFPRAPKAPEAKAALAQIERDRAAAQKSESARAEIAAARATESKLPQVTRINHWNNPNNTRVVITVEDAVKFQSARISTPDRIYFDIYTAKLSSTLAGKTLEVGGGFLKAIRVAQNQAGVVRVVLDVERVKDYSAFLLQNPYRLVVDVYGEAEPQQVAQAEERSEPAKVADARPGESRPAEARPSESKETARSEKSPEGPAPARGTEKTEVASSKPPEKAPPKSAGPGKGAEAVKVAAEPPAAPKPTRNGMGMTRALGLKIGRIVIDPGHGGHDTGTIGPTGLMEKDLCLDIAKRLGKMIEEKIPGMEVVYTRTDDTFVPLEARAPIANQAKADVFISIHANASPRDRNARGIETYYLNFSASDDALEVAARENATAQSTLHELQDIIKKIANNEKIEESRELAIEVQSALAGRMQRVSRHLKDRGVKKAPFVVLIGANMPSVLAEVSFLSNPTDEAMLKRPEHRERVAEGLYLGIEKYLRNLQGTLTLNRPAAAGGPGAQ